MRFTAAIIKHLFLISSFRLSFFLATTPHTAYCVVIFYTWPLHCLALIIDSNRRTSTYRENIWYILQHIWHLMMMIIAWSSDYCCILCRYFNEMCSICLLHLLSTAVYSLCIALWWRRGSDLRHGDVERLLRVEQRHVVVAVEPTLRLAFPACFLLPSVHSVHLSLVSQALKEFFLAVAPRLPRLLGSGIRRRLRWSRGVSASVRRLASFISRSLPLNAAVHHLWKTLWLIACLDVFNPMPCGVHHWPKTEGGKRDNLS